VLPCGSLLPARRSGKARGMTRIEKQKAEHSKNREAKSGVQKEKKEDHKMNENRDKTIIRTSIIGILVNVLLAAFKAVVGLLSHSIAVVMDAVNNLSDALSSVITILGTKLAGKEPDKKHPLGYGRIEYLSAMIISVIVLYAGVSSLVESVKKILHPEKPDYSATALLIIAVAVVAKIILGSFVKKKGLDVKSDSLVASGSDALHDSIISASTLAAAVIYLFFHISLEAWLGAIISAVIVKSGLDMLRDTVSEILGERIDAETAQSVKDTICQTEGVRGAYDLVINNYGPNRQIGSVHIEVPDTMTVGELDGLEREISMNVFQKHHIILTGISVYSMNVDDAEAVRVETGIRKILEEYPDVLQMHGFFLDKNDRSMKFDIIISYDAPNRKQIYKEITKRVKAAFPAYTPQVQLDYDISD
jgi:cation diffusion facilitator family transporter